MMDEPSKVSVPGEGVGSWERWGSGGGFSGWYAIVWALLLLGGGCILNFLSWNPVRFPAAFHFDSDLFVDGECGSFAVRFRVYPEPAFQEIGSDGVDGGRTAGVPCQTARGFITTGVFCFFPSESHCFPALCFPLRPAGWGRSRWLSLNTPSMSAMFR